MTSFESNSKKSGPFFGGFSNGRKRRHDSARKPNSRKFLDQFTLEKMEERWMPVITPSYNPTSGALTFSYGSANDSLSLTATGISGANNSFSWSGSVTSNGTQANVSSIIFNDTVSGANQTVRFNANQIIVPMSANGLETFNFNGGNITSNLVVSNSISTFTGSTGSSLARACVTNANLNLLSTTLNLGQINATGSNITVSSSGYGSTVLNQSGGSASVAAVPLGTFIGTDGVTATFRTGSTVTTANLSNGIGASTLLVNRGATSLTTLNLSSGTVTMYGTVGTINQSGGQLTLGFDPDTSSGSSSASVNTLFTITNGQTVVTDSTELKGPVTVNGSSNVSILAGSNGTPALKSNFIVNNGTVSIANGVSLQSCNTFTQNNGVVSLTGVVFDGPVLQGNGSLTINTGTFGSGLSQSGGILSVDGASFASASAGVAPLAISGGSATVLNSTIASGFDDTNAANVTGTATSVNFGNQSTPGNNTFTISGNGTRYFIKNQVAGLTISALGNTWTNNTTNYDPATQPWSIQNYLLSVQSYSGGLATSGPIYFNGTNLYVLNNQQGTGINFIQSAIDASLSNGTVNVQGGSNVYDEPNLFTQISLDLTGVDTGAGLPTLRPSGAVDKIFAVYDSMIGEVPPGSGNFTTIPTQAFPVVVNFSNFNLDGASLTSPDTTKYVGVNYAYYANSSLTLGGTLNFSNFSASNSQVLDLQGGKLTVATTNNLSAPSHISVTAIDGTFTVAANSTLVGSINSGTPGTDALGNPVAQTTVIAGTLQPLYAGDAVSILGGLVSVPAGGLIDGESVLIQGGNLSVTGGTITKAVSLTSGRLDVTSGTLSGSLSIDGGTTNITGGSFSTVTNELNSISHTITITQGEVNITGANISASYANGTYRDALFLNAPTTASATANLSIGNTNIVMGATNNVGVAGLRTSGSDTTATGFGNIVLTFNDNLAISGGDNSILIDGINTQITGNTLGNITLTNPANNFIKFDNYAFYDQVTGLRTLVYGGNVTYQNNSPSYSFQPVGDFSIANIPTIFNIESKVTDYASSSTVGYVYLYSEKNFVLNGQSIQRVVDTVGTNESIYIQYGTFPESVTVLNNQTGTAFYGAGYYDPSNQTIVNPVNGSNSAFLIQANSVTIDGLTITGANGTTALLHNGSLSGVNYGVTNYNGTSFAPINNLTLTNSSLSNLINAGVYLNNNGQDSGSSFVSNSCFTNIGRTGLVGGVVLGGNFYVETTSTTMSGVTNGIVMTDFTNAPSGSAAIIDNTISSYATGITLSNFTGSASVSYIGSTGAQNTLTYALGMNNTLGAGLAAKSVGIYLQGLTGSILPDIGDNIIDGYAYGYDITNVNQPITVAGGSVANASVAGVAVLKNQTFDPNVAAPGVGTYSPNVTLSNLSVAGYPGAVGFKVDGNGVANGAKLLLNCGTSFSDHLVSPSTTSGALVSNGASLTLNDASIVSDGNSNSPIGISNQNATLVINSPATVTGFTDSISQSGIAAQTSITGGSVTGQRSAILVNAGNASVTGGSLSGQFGLVSNNPASIITIDSTSGNTSITGSVNGIFACASSSVTISQSASNLTSVSGNLDAVAVGVGDLTVNGGTFTSNTTTYPTILFDSVGNLTVTGGQVQSPGLDGTIGILVSNGSASITGGTLDGNAAEGIQFTSTTGNLTITGNATSPVIAAQNIAVNITASNAGITGGLIQASNGIGIAFSSTGTLTFNSNVSATTDGLYLTNGFTTISGGTISNAANGVLFDSASANGSISGLTFTNTTNDLVLASTTGGVQLGANNSFSASGYYILNQTSENFLIDPTTIFSGNTLSGLSAANTTQRTTLFGIEDKIVDKIDNSSFGLVRLKPTELFVTTGSYYAPNTFANIQRAIDAASSGYTVYVQNGTYTNNLDVNKSLTVQGDSAGNTTVTAASTTTPTVTVSASGVNLSCLTLSGTSNAGTGLFVNTTVSNLDLSCMTFSSLAQAIEIGSAGQLTTLGLTTVTLDGNTNGISVDAGGSLTNATFSQIEINNVSGTLFNLAGDVTGLSVTNVNGTNGGTVLDVSGTTTNLTINTANFTGSVNGMRVASSGSLTNATLTSATLNNLTGYVGLFDGTVNGLNLSSVTATNAAGSVLTFNNTSTNVVVSNSNFSSGQANGVTLGSSGSLTNASFSNIQMNNLTGSAANLAGSVSNLTFSSVSASYAGASSFVFGASASQVSLTNVTATNISGSVLTFASTLTDLNVTNSNFASANGSVLTLNGSTTNLTVSGTNFSNAAGNAFTLASGQSLINATLSNDEFDYANGTFANLQGPVNNLTLTDVTASHSTGSALTFGDTASSVSLSNVTATNAGGSVLSFSASGLTGLNVTNSNFVAASGNVLTLNGTSSNLMISGTNFSNATGNAFTLAPGQSLTNATLSNDQFDYAGGTFANLQGPVSSLTLTNVTASHSNGTALTFGDTASSVSLSNVTATNAGGSVLTFSASGLTGLNVTNSNFVAASGNVLTLNGTSSNLVISGTNFSNATGNAFTLAASKALTNATLSNDQFDYANGTFANLSGSVTGLTLTNVTASHSTGSALTFGDAASSVSLSNVTATNSGGSVLTFSASTLTDLSVSNSNFASAGGSVLTFNGDATNVTVGNTNFNNATGHGISLASGKVLTNATFTNVQLNNLGGWGANLAGSVNGLTIQDSSFNTILGTALTLSGSASNVNLSNVSYVGHTDGIVVSSAVTGLTLNNVTLDGSGNGLTVTTAGSVNGLTISNSLFANGTYGILAQADTSISTNQSRLTSVSITGSTFAGNANAGLSLGMLNDAVLSNLNVHNNGASTPGSGGILLNLTNGTFANITLNNVTAADNGLGGNSTTAGFGIAVLTTNGSVSGLTLNNVTISGNGSSVNSLVGLELGNSVALGSTSISGLTVSGANTTGLYLHGQSSGQTLNIGNANFDSTLAKYIVTESTGTVVTATAATFGGVSAGSGLTAELAYPIVDKITDSVDESSLGKVLIRSGSTYVTPNSFTTNTSTPSIQRAITQANTGDTIWIQGNNATANYTGGVDTSVGGKTLTLDSGNSTNPALVNTEGDWTLSAATTINVRLGGNSTDSFTQYNLYNQSVPMNLSNAVLAYSNLTGYVPTIGDQYNILNQVGSSTNATTSRLEANVSGVMTVLTNGGRNQLASGQYFMSIYEGGSNHNDFVLISAPAQVSNVVVYGAWNDPNIYLGDPVYYVNGSGATVQLTYGLTAASNITTGSAQLESTNATMSIANGTYAQVLSKGSLVGNQTYNIIGLSNVSGSFIPDGQQIGNITVSGISLVPSDTINYRVNGGVFGQFDEINTNGPIVLGNAVANIAISNTFVAPPSLNSWLPLVNNTHPSAAIGGQFRFANGTQIDTGMPLPIPNDPAHDLYTTYKFGTQAPYNDFALIWSLAPGTQTQVVVDASWAGVEFGAVQAFNGANYTIGLDGFAQMNGYSPVAGTSLVGGVAAVSANGTITIANGTYNGTFSVNKGFQLVGPTGANQAATFPLASGQTVLQAGANVSSTNWTGSLRFGNLYVGSGTIFNNVANIVDSNGLLTFDSGAVYTNVSLSAPRSMTIQSNLAGTPVIFTTATGTTGLSATGAGVNLTLSDITVNGTGTGMNMTNTGSIIFNNVTLGSSLSAPGTFNGPTSLTLNYPASTASNILTVAMSNMTFSPFGTNPVSILTANNFSLNANLGTTAGSAGNNTIAISSNMISAGSLLQTGNGRDTFNISSAAPVVIKAGAGNDTLAMLTAGAYVQSFDGESGTDTLKGGPQANLFDISGDSTGTLYLTQGCATTSTAFSNTEGLIGSLLSDNFYFTNNLSRMATVNGGLGNDYLNFNGTSGANTSSNYTNQLEFNVTGASIGNVNYFNLGNLTATTSVIDSFVSLENLVGGLADDVVRMKSTDNGSGAYIMGTIAGSLDGAAGNNTIDYSSYAAGVSVNLTNKSATGVGSSSNLRVNNIRDAYGSSYNDVLIGDEKPNILVGNNGNDSIVGNAGNDMLIGSYGTDTLVGGAGWNLDIGGYVDFQGGGNATAAYGIPSQYVDFVLRNLMAQSNWGNVSDLTSFNNAANICESTGVSFYVPGTVSQFSSIRLYSGSGSSGPDGTVFDDSQQNSINPGTSLQQAWLFYTSRDTYDGSKVRRASKIWKSFP